MLSNQISQLEVYIFHIHLLRRSRPPGKKYTPPPRILGGVFFAWGLGLLFSMQILHPVRPMVQVGYITRFGLYMIYRSVSIDTKTP